MGKKYSLKQSSGPQSLADCLDVLQLTLNYVDAVIAENGRERGEIIPLLCQLQTATTALRSRLVTGKTAVETEGEWEYASPRNMNEALNIMESVAEDIFDFMPPSQMDVLDAAYNKVQDGLTEIRSRLKS